MVQKALRGALQLAEVTRRAGRHRRALTTEERATLQHALRLGAASKNAACSAAHRRLCATVARRGMADEWRDEWHG